MELTPYRHQFHFPDITPHCLSSRYRGFAPFHTHITHQAIPTVSHKMASKMASMIAGSHTPLWETICLTNEKQLLGSLPYRINENQVIGSPMERTMEWETDTSCRRLPKSSFEMTKAPANSFTTNSRDPEAELRSQPVSDPWLSETM